MQLIKTMPNNHSKTVKPYQTFQSDSSNNRQLTLRLENPKLLQLDDPDRQVYSPRQIASGPYNTIGSRSSYEGSLDRLPETSKSPKVDIGGKKIPVEQNSEYYQTQGPVPKKQIYLTNEIIPPLAIHKIARNAGTIVQQQPKTMR